MGKVLSRLADEINSGASSLRLVDRGVLLWRLTAIEDLMRAKKVDTEAIISSLQHLGDILDYQAGLTRAVEAGREVFDQTSDLNAGIKESLPRVLTALREAGFDDSRVVTELAKRLIDNGVETRLVGRMLVGPPGGALDTRRGDAYIAEQVIPAVKSIQDQIQGEIVRYEKDIRSAYPQGGSQLVGFGPAQWFGETAGRFFPVSNTKGETSLRDLIRGLGNVITGNPINGDQPTRFESLRKGIFDRVRNGLYQKIPDRQQPVSTPGVEQEQTSVQVDISQLEEVIELGSIDPTTVDLENRVPGVTVLYHGSSRPLRVSLDYDPSLDEEADASETLGTGLYTTDDKNQAQLYANLRRRPQGGYVSTIIPYRARMLDLRNERPVPEALFQAWVDYWLNVFERKKATYGSKSDKTMKDEILFGFQQDYTNFLLAIRNNPPDSKKRQIRYILATMNIPEYGISQGLGPIQNRYFAEFMRSLGIDGIIAPEGGDSGEFGSSDSFVFYNYGVVGTKEDWIKRAAPVLKKDNREPSRVSEDQLSTVAKDSGRFESEGDPLTMEEAFVPDANNFYNVYAYDASGIRYFSTITGEFESVSRNISDAPVDSIVTIV
ncbi:MAG: hypothetical protein UY97_C0028G0003, partial [Parcubacteria group bacterium GW2011_GWB1_57_6]